MEVAAVVGNTVTFTTPFHVSFRVTQTAQLSRYGEDWKVVGHPNGTLDAALWSGVEDIKVVNDNYGAQYAGNFSIEHAAYCWLKNVESDHAYEGGVNLVGAFRSELRDSYIHDSWPVNGGAGYSIDLNYGASDNLVENNISWYADKVIVMRASGGGNVVGYNFMDCAFINDPALYNFTESGLNAAHETCPHMELFEGNQSFRFDADETHGNSIYITAFRNHLTGRRLIINTTPPVPYTTDDGTVTVTTGAHSWWFNFVGNVLGTSTGLMKQPQTSWLYDKQGTDIGDDTSGGFWTQATNASNESMSSYDRYNTDNLTYLNGYAPAIRHGNFNFAAGPVAAGIVWDPAISNHVLPSSFYLPANPKPPFFGNNAWPWVTPENTSAPLGTLPARARFEAIRGL